jgi:hypothetical protein
MAKQPTRPLATLDRSAPRIVLGATFDEFVVQALLLSLAKVVLGLALDGATKVALTQRDHLRHAF